MLPEPYYDRDGITIFCGDCRDILSFLQPTDLVLTDPPYGVTYESNTGGRRGKQPITNDGTRLSLRMYRQVIPLIQANHILWFTRWDAWPDVWELLGQSFPMRGLLVWDKGSPGMGDLEHWGPSYELIASVGRGKTIGSRDQSVLRFSGVSTNVRNHPTEKPVPLLRYLMEKLDAGTVVDPFMGAGSTLVAAQQAGRRAIGIELEERYCEIAVKRLQQSVLPGMEAA